MCRTPAGLYSPEYSVEEERLGFEVRCYASYAVCSAPMKVGEAPVLSVLPTPHESCQLCDIVVDTVKRAW